MVDVAEGVLGIEWIHGKSVRFLLGGGAEGEDDFNESEDGAEAENATETENDDPLAEYNVTTGTSLFPAQPVDVSL